MAKLSLDAEIELLLKSGDVLVESGRFEDKDGNAMLIRNMDSTSDPLEVGDIIIIPQNYKVLKTKFTEDGDAYPYIVTEVKSEDGSERNFRFFPNSLCKTAYPLDKDGKRLAKAKTSGSASELFRSKTTIDEGLALLRGKNIKVVNADSYLVKEYNSQTTKTTHIYQYDLV